jgi:four helix bundle protein
MGNFEELHAYKKAYMLALKIFSITKLFPPDEKFSLTDQIRRSSRSVCANIAEAYGRRSYKKHFLSKLNDAQAENCETHVWIDFSKDFHYLKEVDYRDLINQNNEVGKLLHFMVNNPEKFK